MKVAIITPAFVDFHPGYSLTGIVRDQVRMLERYGHEVEVWVGETYSYEDPSFTIKKIIPISQRPGWIDYSHLKEYYEISDQKELSVIRPDTQEVITPTDHVEISNRFSQILVDNLKDIDIVLTHDILFTGWNLPLYLGIMRIALEDSVKHVRWLHWIHSCPNAKFDWWALDDLGPYHRLVYPNEVDAVFCWEGWHTAKDMVKVIPHIKDIRLVNRFVPESWEFIEKYPALLSADVVQIYPAGTDRLSPKRLKEVILIFKYLKEAGASVCLVCANQWATGRQQKEDLEEYYNIALNNGLTFQEFIFTSEFKPEYGIGISYDMLMDLFKCSNLFVFPTWSESFGLVLPEAILSSCVMPVMNADLPQLMLMTGGRGLNYKFGSMRTIMNWESEEHTATYLRSIALSVYETMSREESIAARTVLRQKLNMDNIYKRYYDPVFNESKFW